MDRGFSIASIEKKARKQIRLHRLISKDDVLYIIDDNRLTNVTAYDLLKRIIKDPSVKILKAKRVPPLLENRKFVSANTIEKESKEYLEEFIEDNVRKENNVIKPLIRISLEECRYYCDKRGLSYEDEEIEKDAVSEFVQRMQKKYDSTMNSIINSEETLK